VYLSDVKVNSASGIVISSEFDPSVGTYKTYILTCKHVLQDIPILPNLVGVRTFDDHERVQHYFKYIAEVVKVGKDVDFSILLVVTPNKVPSVKYNTDYRLGDMCYAVGSPIGQPIWLSSGIVASKQTDTMGVTCELNPGNSGGMIVNKLGELIGISHAVMFYKNNEITSRGDGLGIGIPISNILDELTKAELASFFGE
jgi:S1-C subfamily serine protease